jgi:hypothetical protein
MGSHTAVQWLYVINVFKIIAKSTHCESKHETCSHMKFIIIYIYSCDRLTFPLFYI